MQQLIFATGNNEKFLIGQAACRQHNVELVQQAADIDEIQSEDPEAIIRDKARRAFESIGQPLVVSDDNWQVPALSGFPGPYMKSIDHWFTPQNWLDLLQHIEDRRIILIQQLAYQDDSSCTLFRKEFTGTFLTEARGNYGKTLQKVVTMPGDNGLSISEAYDNGASHGKRLATAGWDVLAEWYSKQHEQPSN
jgi:XTP/dITP diphosphohydrolase